MSSQNNRSKISLNKISNYILSEQNVDIRSYTSGHLNENHLWKTPEQKTHKTWETSNLIKHDNLNKSFEKNLLPNNSILRNIKKPLVFIESNDK